MSKKYRLLIIEDNQDHVELLRERLQKSGMDVEITVTCLEQDLKEILKVNPPDLIIADYLLPDFTGIDALKLTRQKYPELPFIVFSGVIGEEKAVDAMLHGASDYVMKDRPKRLIPAVKRELANYKEEQKKDQKLTESQSRYQALVQSVDGIVWEADAKTFTFNYVSPQSEEILGYTPDQWYNEKEFWKNHIHPEDRQEALQFCHHKSQEGENHVFEYRMITADKKIVWLKDYVTVVSHNGDPFLLRGVMIDITEAKIFSDLERLENNLLTMAMKDQTSLQDILDFFIKGLESLFPRMIPSILKVKNNRVYHWAASDKLPARYLAAINGEKIGPKAGSCGTAAYLNQKVIVPDIATDPNWELYKEVALQDGLKACWSQPLTNKKGQVIGTFAVYYNEPREPTGLEEKVIEHCKNILQILLENKQSEQALKKNKKLLDKAYDLASIGHWELDTKNSTLHWSYNVKQIHEVDEDYQPELDTAINFYKEGRNRERVAEIVEHAIADGEAYDEELQIITAEGNEKSVRVVGESIFKNGECILLFGSIQDITERSQREHKLTEMLREKETLLMEVNHRVKNNLAVVSGMMQLQAYEEDDSELQKKLLDSVSRIQTMAAIHELWYKSNSLSRIMLGQNIKNLVSNIIETQQLNQDIRVRYSLEEIELNINQAIPFSLVINEVITNALKHAYADEGDGIIDITIFEQNGDVHLNIKDDGKGLPDDFNSSRNGASLGVTLINTLSNQLNGTFEYNEAEEGTSFALVFKKSDTKGSSSTFINK